MAIRAVAAVSMPIMSPPFLGRRSSSGNTQQKVRDRLPPALRVEFRRRERVFALRPLDARVPWNEKGDLSVAFAGHPMRL
jgi:hypothetical protein